MDSMAVKDLFGKMVENVKIPNTQSTGGSTSSLKKTIDEKLKEKNQVYSFIGMEVYDQCQEKKLEIPGIEIYLEKMKELDAEIAELETKRQSIELQKKGTTICQCGNVLSANQSFCTNCGCVVNNGKMMCICGAEVGRNEKFCPHCGTDLQQLQQGNPVPPQIGMAQPQMGMVPPGFGVAQPQAGMAPPNFGMAQANGMQPNVMMQQAGQPPMMRPGMQQATKTCICGAKVPEGQFMCMECGRKIE